MNGIISGDERTGLSIRYPIYRTGVIEYMKDKDEIRINLGCGDRKLEGYINIDIREDVQPDIVHDVISLPFTDNSVNRIEAHHLLEHFSFRKTGDILFEWYRVLEPGGMLLVEVPDFDTIIDKYLRRQDVTVLSKAGTFSEKNITDKLKSLLSYILHGDSLSDFMKRMIEVACFPFRRHRRVLTDGLIGELMGGQDYTGNVHYTVFNFDYLKRCLESVGFRSVVRIPSKYLVVQGQKE